MSTEELGKFTPEEIAYLQSQRYGRLATVSQNGELHVVPVTFRYHPEEDFFNRLPTYLR